MMPIDRMSCQDVFTRLDDFLDRELTTEEMGLIRAHLEACVVCASEHRFERGILDSLRGKVRRLPVPPGLEARVRLAIAQARRQP